MRNKTLVAVGVALGFLLVGCGYEPGEVVEVEIEQGEHGEVKELEVSREGGLDAEDTFEVTVPLDSPCDEGDIYPACKEG